MQKLEKILCELEKRIFTAEVYNDDFDGTTITNLICLGDVREVLEDQMNDGWIPVEERLPEESGYYLVQLSEKLPNEDYSDRVVVLYSEEDKDFMCYSSLIIAWRSLPEPYRPERSEE